MKPFFSIRIDYRPADSAEIVSFDQHTLRLTIGRETEWDDGKPNTESLVGLSEKVAEAILWLGDKADFAGRVGFASLVISDLRSQCRDGFVEALEDAAEISDDDELEELRRAIVNGEKKSRGEA